MSEWQDIATAPKDGTRFIGWHPDGYVDFFHWQDFGSKYPDAPVGFRDGFIRVFTDSEGPYFWMPLPLTPVTP